MASTVDGLAESIGSDEEMRSIQINLNHCKVAKQILSQTIYEMGIEVGIISELYRNN